MRSIPLTAILLLFLGAAAFADDQSDREKLLGSWEQGAAENSPVSSWTISPDKDLLRITELEGGNKITEFSCAAGGAACEIKDAGKKATVSLWFNGPQLVVMETKGSEIVKRRFKILPQGDVMEMEVIPIVPSGKTETFQFKRVQLAARQE